MWPGFDPLSLALRFLRAWWLPLTALAALVAWSVLVWQHGYEAADLRAQYRESLAAQAAQQRVLEVQAAHRQEMEQQQALIAVMEANAYATLQEKTREIDRLRADVAAGAVRLRVKARCPSVPAATEDAPGAGVDTGGTAFLDPAAEPAYFALRQGLEQQHAQLKACIGILGGLGR